MLAQETNELLTRVGPGTPAGQLLRRYWQPVCPAADLPKDGAKKRVKIMGEDVVVFRLPRKSENDPIRYGCVGERCSHRGASLYYGFVEEDGIRCAYHGWKYDERGRCVHQPFEKNPEYKNEVRHPAYPVEKLAGLLFIYMGPPERKPLLPRWDVLVRRDGKRTLEVHEVLRCNWLQAMENSADTVHTYYLHGHMMKTKGIAEGAYFYRPIEDYDWELCEWGIIKRCDYGGSRPEHEVRPPLVFPNILRIPQGYTEAVHWRVPIDDERTQIFVMLLDPSKDGKIVEQPEDPPISYVPYRDENGEYILTTFPSQDAMAWETQGAVYDRTNEKLGSTDRGITVFRNMLREQIAIVQKGGDPMALVWDEEKNRIIEFEGSKSVLV
jgi:5,5'-dehydrodivanillate O-demethylase